MAKHYIRTSQNDGWWHDKDYHEAMEFLNGRSCVKEFVISEEVPHVHKGEILYTVEPDGKLKKHTVRYDSM